MGPMTRRVTTPDRLLRLALTAGACVFVWTNAATVDAAITGIRGADFALILCGIGLSLVAMYNRGLLNHAAHRSVGLAPGRGDMATTAAVGFAANKLLRSGGASGLAVFVRQGRRAGFAAGRVSAACVIAAASSLAALGVILAATIGLLGVTGRLEGWWLVVGIGFLAYCSILLLAVASALRSEQHMTRLWTGAQRLGNRVLRRRRPIDVAGVSELYGALGLARGNRRWTDRVLAHALMSKALGAAMLHVSSNAVGIQLSPAGAMVIYTAVLMASMASVMPAGVGVVEAAAGAMFVAAGAPFAVAAVAVALFRIFDVWIPVAAGAVLGRDEMAATRPARSRPARPTAAGLAVADDVPAVAIATVNT